MLAISQSGTQRRSHRVDEERQGRPARSPSAVVNVTDSPLADTCDIVLPICAGPELSVAATQDLRRHRGGAGTADGRLGRRRAPCGDAIARLPARLADATALDWSAAVPARRRARQPRHHRPRPDARDRPRSRAQAQGDVQPARRGLQRRRVPARAGGARFLALSDPDVHADRCGGAGHAPARRRPAPQGHGAVRRRAGRGERRRACRRCRPTSRRPMPSASSRASTRWPSQLAQRLDIDVDRPRHLSKVTSTL